MGPNCITPCHICVHIPEKQYVMIRQYSVFVQITIVLQEVKKDTNASPMSHWLISKVGEWARPTFRKKKKASLWPRLYTYIHREPFREKVPFSSFSLISSFFGLVLFLCSVLSLLSIQLSSRVVPSWHPKLVHVPVFPIWSPTLCSIRSQKKWAKRPPLLKWGLRATIQVVRESVTRGRSGGLLASSIRSPWQMSTISRQISVS